MRTRQVLAAIEALGPIIEVPPHGLDKRRRAPPHDAEQIHRLAATIIDDLGLGAAAAPPENAAHAQKGLGVSMMGNGLCGRPGHACRLERVTT